MDGRVKYAILKAAAAAIALGSALLGCVNPLAEELKSEIIDYKISQGVVSPQIDVKQGDTLIGSGGLYNFGSVQVGNQSQEILFTIENAGQVRLTISGISLASGSVNDFILNAQDTSMTVPAGGSTTLGVTFAPSAAGAGRQAQVKIVNNCAAVNQGEYVFTVQGTGVAVPVPDIAVEQNTSPVASGSGIYEIGDVAVNTTTTVQFEVKNTGNANLELTGNPWRVSVTDATGSFSATAQPSSPILQFGSSFFTISFLPTTLGLKSATVTIPNNDPDASENPYTFTIRGTAKVRGSVLDPNGGEAFKPGTVLRVSWIPFENLSTVTIELTGTASATISSNATDSVGFYDWTIPGGQTGGSNYKVKITNNQPPGQSDESDASFAIGSISGVAPNGGATYKAGETPNITWASDLGGGLVNIALYSGGSLDTAIANNVIISGFPYPWTVPAREGNAFRIRVSSAANPTDIYDQSDTNFSIGTSITGVAPTATACSPGAIQPIAWSSGVGGTVKIDLLQNDVFLSAITASTANTGSYNSWTVPALSGTNYKIRVTCNENTGLVGTSAANFAIGTITVTYPNGGEAFEREAGTPVNIAWTSDVGGNVKIDVLKGGILNRTLTSSAPNSGSYDWYMATDQTLGNDMTVRVSSVYNAAVTDSSNAAFKINGWMDYGNAANFSGSYPRMAIGNDGKPFVIASDYYDSDKAKVFKWASGMTWTNLGTLSSGTGGNFGIAVSADATPVPYVVFGDGASTPAGRPHVMKYSGSGTTWDDLGYAYATGVGACDIAMDTTTVPVVAIRNAASPYEAHAYRYAGGTSWTDLTPVTAVSADGVQIVMKQGSVDHYSYVGYRDGADSSRVHVKLGSGGGWIDLGRVSTTVSPEYALTLDLLNEKPIVVITDPQPHVYRYSSGTTWTDLGDVDTSTGSYPSITVHPSDNNPIVAYVSSNTVRIKKYNGTTWVDYGTVPGTYSLLYSIVCEPTGEMMPLVLVWRSGDYNPIRVYRRVFY